MLRDRSLQHQVIATTHEVSEAGMVQHMRGQLYLRFAPQLAEHQINRTRGQSSPFQVQKKSRLRDLGEALGALFEPELQDLTYIGIERDFTRGLSLARVEVPFPRSRYSISVLAEVYHRVSFC